MTKGIIDEGIVGNLHDKFIIVGLCDKGINKYGFDRT